MIHHIMISYIHAPRRIGLIGYHFDFIRMFQDRLISFLAFWWPIIDPDVDKELHNVTESLPLVVLIPTQTLQKSGQLQEPCLSMHLSHDIPEDILERFWKVPDIWDHCHIHKAYLVDVPVTHTVIVSIFFPPFLFETIFFNLYIVQKNLPLESSRRKNCQILSEILSSVVISCLTVIIRLRARC